MPRADAQRTGTAEGIGNIEKPAVYWRSFEGGGSTVRGVLDIRTEDVSFAVISGGAVELYGAEPGPALWRTENIGARSLAGESDLNGDGTFEVVVATGNAAIVLDGLTGKVLWRVPDGLLGTLETIRIADFTGDGVSELVVTECGCCGQNSGHAGFIWDFSASFENPRVVWEMPSVDCGAKRASVAVDSDGDGSLEWFAPRIGGFQLFEPTGEGLVAQSEPISSRIVSFRTDCRAAQLLPDAAQEVVCLYNDPLVTGDGGHRLHAFKHNSSTGALDLLWQFDVGETSAAVLSDSALTDVDGDGVVEVLANGEQQDGTVVGYALNGEDGSVSANMPGVQLRGAVLNGRIVLGNKGGDLVAFDLRQGSPREVWRVADRVVVTQWRRERAGVSGHFRRNPVVVDQDDTPRLLVRSGDGLIAELLTLPTAGGLPTSTTLELAAGGALAQGSASGGDLLWTDSRGFAYLTEDVPSVGKSFRLGGYYANAAPRTHGRSHAVGSLRRRKDQEVFAIDSTGALRALQASNAGNVVPPVERLRLSRSHNPILSSERGRLACLTRQLPDAVAQAHDLRLLKANGEEVWKREIPARLQTDMMSGDLNGDGVDDYVTQWSDPVNPELVTVAVDGSSGDELWKKVLPAASNQQPYGVTLSDFDGDGLLDVSLVYGFSRVLSGLTGEELAFVRVGGSYGTVTAYQDDDDSPAEYVVHGGFYQRVVLDDDLSLRSTLDDELPRVFVSGVVVQCGDEGEPRLFEPTANAPGAVDFFDLRGPAYGNVARWIYAGGERYATEAEAKDAGQQLAKLNSPSAHVNLTGAERTIAVMGSEDGWLYAVDACSGELAWSLAFDAPVGAVAFGDTDGNGLDEVIVSVADGYLYGVKHQPVEPPTSVAEAVGGSPLDVDSLAKGDDLWVHWTPVEGVTHYEVQLVDDNGKAIRGGFERAAESPFVYSGDELRLGVKYTASVRAAIGTEVSPDVAGDGVTVLRASASIDPVVEEEEPPSGKRKDNKRGAVAAVAAGCACELAGNPGSGSGSIWFGLFGFGLLLSRRRMRGRSRS